MRLLIAAQDARSSDSVPGDHPHEFVCPIPSQAAQLAHRQTDELGRFGIDQNARFKLVEDYQSTLLCMVKVMLPCSFMGGQNR